MLKAKFFQPRILKMAVAKFHENNISELRVIAVCDGIIGDSQAVMSVIGILADMGEDSLECVENYPEKAFNELHGSVKNISRKITYPSGSWIEIDYRNEQYTVSREHGVGAILEEMAKMILAGFEGCRKFVDLESQVNCRS